MPRIEVSPVDELNKGVKGAPAPPESPDERDARGRFRKGAKTAQAEGGRKRKKTVKFTRRMGLMDETQLSPDFLPYKRAAEAFRRAFVSELAQQVGGGVCGVMASSLVTKAAWQEAAGTFFFERAMMTNNAGLAKTASSILNDARQNSLAAWEICAKMAGGKSKRGMANEALILAQAKFQKALLAEQRKAADEERKRLTAPESEVIDVSSEPITEACAETQED